MDNLTSVRTPQLIAVEINFFKEQTRKITLVNSVEIGRRLKEAKDLVPHGEWGRWLAESVNYSQRTADYLMQICEEYGSDLLASSAGEGDPNSQSIANLTYTQALLLLGVPEEERGRFIAENNVENMTARELRQAVDEKQRALRENENLKKELTGKNSEISKLNTLTQSLENQVEGYKQKYQAEQDKVGAKQRELKEVKETNPSSREIAELEDQVKTAAAQVSVMAADAQFSFYRNQIIRASEELLKTLTELNRRDPELKEKNRQAAHDMLQNLADMLKEWPPPIRFIVQK